jgi:hypothetical protein
MLRWLKVEDFDLHTEVNFFYKFQALVDRIHLQVELKFTGKHSHLDMFGLGLAVGIEKCHIPHSLNKNCSS